jgi:hypothetical protein
MAEIEGLRRRWGDLLYNDPYYNPVFNNDDFGVPVLGRRGEYREKAELLSYFDRVRRNFRSGGLPLVVKRSRMQLRHQGRRVKRRLRAEWRARSGSAVGD